MKTITKLLALFLVVGGLSGTFLVAQADYSEVFDLDEVPDLELLQESDYNRVPGEIDYIGEERSEPVTINVTKYNTDSLIQEKVDSAAAAHDMVADGFVTWVDVNGLHDETIIKEFSDAFDFSPTAREDIANTTKLPQLQEGLGYLFISLKMLNQEGVIDSAQIEQINLFLGSNYVISFQENSDNDFEDIQKRIANSEGNVRSMGSDYLTFVLIDTVVDSYLPAMDIINDQIDSIEKQLVDSPNDEVLKDIYVVKREVTISRQILVPLREVLSNLVNYDYQFISPETKDYFHITYENVDYVSSIVETFGGIASDMVNFYISVYGHNTTHILKFLTIFSTVLLILSFVAGIYGMNFSQFHEKQKMRRGHLMVIFIMIFLALVTVLFFFVIDWL